MFDSMKNLFQRYAGGINRRELFRKGGLLAVPGLLRRSKAAAAPPVNTIAIATKRRIMGALRTAKAQYKPTRSIANTAVGL